MWCLVTIFPTLQGGEVDSNSKKILMKKGFISFAAGVAVGAVFGLLIGDEEKKKIQKALKRQAEKLMKAYDAPIREGAASVKRFINEYLH